MMSLGVLPGFTDSGAHDINKSGTGCWLLRRGRCTESWLSLEQFRRHATCAYPPGWPQQRCRRD